MFNIHSFAMERRYFYILFFAYTSLLHFAAPSEPFEHISTCIFGSDRFYDEYDSDIGQSASGIIPYINEVTFICRESNMEQIIFNRDSITCRLGKRGYSVSIEYGRIGTIHFENCKFHDIDSIYFKNFTMLRNFDVSNTGLETISIEKLHRLHLTHFNASRNQLATFPRSLLKVMFYLEALDISNNAISHIDPSDFEGAKNLLTLKMSHNHLVEIPLGLYRDTNRLAVVDFSSNAINQVRTTAFVGAKNLTSLNLSNNRLKSLENHLFDSMLKLKYLNLSYNPIGNLKMDTLTYLTNLEHLDLRRTDISDIMFGTFSFQSKLISLDLAENDLKSLDFDLFLPILQHLRTLRLADNQLRNLDGFENKLFPQLTLLDIKNNKFECHLLIKFMKTID